jgi:HEAT repeat protein
MPDAFEEDLVATTQGNPLFLSEIIRKLVADRKVNLVGQEWVIEPLEEGYLPKSLEEIVIEKIAALDDEGMDLLARASTMGEDISVSMLTGSADLDENKVLEFLDRAETLGLVKMDFQVNDEVMRFLGKRVMDISYGSVDEDRRSKLHEQAGQYHERLYQQSLLPSASLLAYHYKRSANQEKAREYERAQVTYTQAVFNADEASHYSGELLDDVDTGQKLERESLPLVPTVLRNLMTAVRNIQLYPPESAAIAQALEQIKEPIDGILERNERLLLSQANNVLLINGQRLETIELNALTESYVELLARYELKGIAFRRGVTQEQLKTLVITLGRTKPDTIEQGFWREFAVEHKLDQIELLQVQYSRVRKSRTTVAMVSAAEDEALSPGELKQVPDVLRALHGAVTNVKLYPVDAQPVVQAVDTLQVELDRFLSIHPTLTLAYVGESLLVNGVKTDTGSYDAVADGFIAFLKSVGIDSITFFAPPVPEEIDTFIDALRDLPSSGTDRGFWDDLATQHGLRSVAFNQRQYTLGVVQSLLDDLGAPPVDEVIEVDVVAALIGTLPDDPTEAVREALPRFGREFLIKGEHKVIRRLLAALFEGFADQDPLGKEQVIQSCSRLMGGLALGLQHKFAELAVSYVLGAFEHETDPRIVQQMATMLFEMAECAVQFADYTLAARILLQLRDRRGQLAEAGESSVESVTRVLDRKLDATTEKLLEEDLSSDDPVRQERAAQVIGALGRPAIPVLVHVIEREKDFRARQMAANVLAEMGPVAALQLKQAIVTGIVVEQRYRVLEVVDRVTDDLRDELEFSLADSNRKIRRAAFQLFERLGRNDLIDIVLPYAYGGEEGKAKGAVRSLGSLGSAEAAEALAAIPKTTKDTELVITCCQALGQIGDEISIAALFKILKQRRFLFFGRRWNTQVRAMAAMALKQISDPSALQVLTRFRRDSDARVKQIARSAMAKED